MEDAAGQEAGIDGPSWVYCCLILLQLLLLLRQLLQQLLLFENITLQLLQLDTHTTTASFPLLASIPASINPWFHLHESTKSNIGLLFGFRMLGSMLLGWDRLSGLHLFFTFLLRYVVLALHGLKAARYPTSSYNLFVYYNTLHASKPDLASLY